MLDFVQGTCIVHPCRTVRPREKQLDDAPQTLQPHPAANLLPMMAPANYEEFKADIAKNGLLESIWLCDGMILDGRHRYRACLELGMEPHFRTYSGESPVSFVWSLNGQRRHLNRAQLAAVGANMLPALSEEARKRQAATGADAPRNEKGQLQPVPAELREPGIKGEAVEVAARLLGIGATNIRYAKAVKESAPDVFEKLETGEMTVDTAYKVAKHRAPKAPPADPATKKPDKAERAAIVARMAESGNRANQIAAHLGISEESVAKIAKSAGVRIFSDKTHRINVQRVIEETVHGLAGYAIGLQAIPETLTGISPQQANEWAESIAESMKPLKHLRARLLGVAHG